LIFTQVVVDAEVAQKLLAEADGVIYVIDASAELSTPAWKPIRDYAADI